MRAFNKQAMMKQKIYEKILATQSEMDYNPVIRFQKIIFNMDKAK